jgi:hypothetical protein
MGSARLDQQLRRPSARRRQRTRAGAGIGLLALIAAGALYVSDRAVAETGCCGGAADLQRPARCSPGVAADDHRNYNRAILAPSALAVLFLVLLLGPGRLRGVEESSVLLALVAWFLAQCGTVAWLLWLGRHRWLPFALRAVSPGAIGGLLAFGAQAALADVVSFFNYRAAIFPLG